MMRKIVFLLLPFFMQAAYPQWVQVCNDFEPNYSIAAFDSTVISGIYQSDNFDLAISTDAGNTWTGSNPFPGLSYLLPLYEGYSWVYACTQNGLYRADKETLNWTNYNQGLPSDVFSVIELDSILLAVNETTLFKRSLEDSSWSVLSDNIPQGYITGFDFDGNMIVVAGSSGVCESCDMGATWTSWTDLQFALGAVVIKGDTIIHASPGGVTRKLISTGTLANVSNGLIKLWTPPPGWDYYGTFEQFHLIGNNIFLCGETGVYKLDDYAWHWVHTGLEYWAYALADNGETLFAVQGGQGIWGRPLDELIVSATENKLLNASLNVYPNPSSGNAIIVIELNDKKEIELSLINMNGLVVYSIYKGELDKGTHRINLNCRDLPKGIYVARLQSSSGISTHKLVIR